MAVFGVWLSLGVSVCSCCWIFCICSCNVVMLVWSWGVVVVVWGCCCRRFWLCRRFHCGVVCGNSCIFCCTLGIVLAGVLCCSCGMVLGCWCYCFELLLCWWVVLGGCC